MTTESVATQVSRISGSLGVGHCVSCDAGRCSCSGVPKAWSLGRSGVASTARWGMRLLKSAGDLESLGDKTLYLLWGQSETASVPQRPEVPEAGALLQLWLQGSQLLLCAEGLRSPVGEVLCGCDDRGATALTFQGFRSLKMENHFSSTLWGG